VRKLALILLALIFPLTHQSENHHSVIYYQAKSEFAITICPGPNNTLLNYSVVVKSGGKVIKSTPLTEQNFFMQITGRMSSPANSKLKNILKEKVLDTCDCVMDDLYNKYLGYNCIPFDQLWKIRYKYDPRFHNMKELPENQGWAKENYCPGKLQFAYILDRYHIKTLNEFIVGDDLYQLLKDVQDTVWIEQYVTLDN
jgi:hypothetical protein